MAPFSSRKVTIFAGWNITMSKKRKKNKKKKPSWDTAWVRGAHREADKEAGILTNAQGPRGIHTVHDPKRANKRRTRKSDKEKAIKDSEE